MAYDFRANQIRTEKLIVSSALGPHRMFIYPVGVATDLQGTIGFNITAVGTDVMWFVSGARGGRGGASPNIGLFGGDLVISGNLHSLNGLTGSLQRLNSGHAYLLAGPNINIVTNSLGQIEISSSAATIHSQSLIKTLELCGYQTTSSSILTRIGGTYFRVQDYTYPGFVSSSIFESIGFVTGGTGSIELYNTTDSTVLSTLVFTENSDTYKSETFVLNQTASVILETRCKYVSGSAYDYAGFMGTKICINYT